MSSVKGKLFEFFVYKLLIFCRFQPVVKDGLLVYNGPAGTMLQGLGQPHNADVLLTPPFQTPFYFPTRLLIECKCCEMEIGLPVIRNALGLREDINHFEIVTEEILKSRRSARSAGCISYPMQRYHYQVAVASMSGFKSTAISFAQAHKIPLISFYHSLLFEDIQACISELEYYAQQDEVFAEKLLDLLKREMNAPDRDFYFEDSYGNIAMEFFNRVSAYRHLITIGLLEDGTILFLVRAEDTAAQEGGEQYDDGYTIHWSTESKAWELHDQNRRYYFELPRAILEEWKRSIVEKRHAALQIKRDYFSRIILFEGSTRQGSGREEIKTIYLSEKFMQEAEQELE
ncbi:MAG: hypothetical protein DBX52_04585 [Clostridiales bacterium]|nr:MAG: hypothetical protein DBX52_04585 [Clostridiales bacterium]